MLKTIYRNMKEVGDFKYLPEIMTPNTNEKLAKGQTEKKMEATYRLNRNQIAFISSKLITNGMFVSGRNNLQERNYSRQTEGEKMLENIGSKKTTVDTFSYNLRINNHGPSDPAQGGTN